MKGIELILFLGGGGFIFGFVAGFVCGRIVPKDSNLLSITSAPKTTSPDGGVQAEKGRPTR